MRDRLPPVRRRLRYLQPTSNDIDGVGIATTDRDDVDANLAQGTSVTFAGPAGPDDHGPQV
jgi:hypothetical protein